MNKKAVIALLMGLLAFGASAKPRLPGPPFPESAPRIFHADFDEPLRLGITNLTVFPAYRDYVESWSGYALKRSGARVTPYTISALSDSGQIQFGSAMGAVRFWTKPYWSSQTAGGNGPGIQAQLMQLVVADGRRAAVVWSIGVSPDGSTLRFDADLGDGMTNLLALDINWQAGQWHCITLNYGTDGTALYVDGQLAGVGESVVAVPPALAGLIIGSDYAGGKVAGGEFDEVCLFSKPLQPASIQFLYAGLSGTAALGPITTQSLARKSTLGASANTMSAMLSGPPSPGGGGGGGGGGTNYSGPPTYTVLALLPPVFTDSNALTLTITNATAGAAYDLYMVTNLNQTNWTWLGRGQAGQTNFSVVINDGSEAYFQLGTLLDSDGDGLPDAYEKLVSNTDPNGFTTLLANGIPFGWYLQHGLNPLAGGLDGLDSDLDGLTNQQEYLYGTDPNASDGIDVWTSIMTINSIP